MATLPPETWAHIASFLPAPARIVFAATCRAAHTLILTSPNVWHTIDLSKGTRDAYCAFQLSLDAPGRLPAILRGISPACKATVRRVFLDGSHVHPALLSELFTTYRALEELSLAKCEGLALGQILKILEDTRTDPTRFPHCLETLRCDSLVLPFDDDGFLLDTPLVVTRLCAFIPSLRLEISFCHCFHYIVKPSSAVAAFCANCSKRQPPLCPACARLNVCAICAAPPLTLCITCVLLITCADCPRRICLSCDDDLELARRAGWDRCADAYCDELRCPSCWDEEEHRRCGTCGAGKFCGDSTGHGYEECGLCDEAICEECICNKDRCLECELVSCRKCKERRGIVKVRKCGCALCQTCVELHWCEEMSDEEEREEEKNKESSIYQSGGEGGESIKYT